MKPFLYINQPCFLTLATAVHWQKLLLTSHSIHDDHIHGVKKLDITQHLCSSSPVLCNACRICVVLVSPLCFAAQCGLVCLWCALLAKTGSYGFPDWTSLSLHPRSPLSTHLPTLYLHSALHYYLHYLQISTHNEQTFIYFVFMTASFLGQHLGWMSKYHRY